MKISDTFVNAEVTLKEALDFYKRIKKVYEVLIPFNEMKRKEVKLTPPLYIQKLSKTLREFKATNFAIMYPHLGLHFINADATDVAATKLSCSLTILSDFYEELEKNYYMIKSDKQCTIFREIVQNIMRNILLFIESQYRLEEYPEIEYLPLFNYCENIDKTIDEFISWFVKEKKQYNIEFYIYEINNQLSSQFLEIYPELYSLSNDLQYPLTLSIASDILNGNIDSNNFYSKLEEYSNIITVTETEGSRQPTLKKLNLLHC